MKLCFTILISCQSKTLKKINHLSVVSISMAKSVSSAISISIISVISVSIAGLGISRPLSQVVSCINWSISIRSISKSICTSISKSISSIPVVCVSISSRLSSGLSSSGRLGISRPLSDVSDSSIRNTVSIRRISKSISSIPISSIPVVCVSSGLSSGLGSSSRFGISRPLSIYTPISTTISPSKATISSSVATISTPIILGISKSCAKDNKESLEDKYQIYVI